MPNPWSSIARMTTSKPRPIIEIAESIGLAPQSCRLYGTDIAKVDPAVLKEKRRRPGDPKLILVCYVSGLVVTLRDNKRGHLFSSYRL